jgi:hypothetical protein
MSYKPKNKYKQVAYLNQKGKYKSTSERGSGQGSRISKNTTPEEALIGQDSSKSLLLYSISLGLLCVNAFEDTTFFYCVVGLGVELSWSFQGFIVVHLIVTMTSESLDHVELMIVVMGSFTPKFITVVAAPIPSFSEVAIINAVRTTTVKSPAVVTIAVSLRRLVVLLTPSNVFSNQLLRVIGIGVFFGSSEELDDSAWPLTK